MTGSRLAQVANQRRRQRKQQKQAANQNNDASSTVASGSNASQETESQPQRENKEVTVEKKQSDDAQPYDLECAPTAASTTFDDSTIASAWTKTSVGQSTISMISDGQSHYDDNETFNFAVGPPMTILSPNKASTPSSKSSVASNDSKPSVVVTTTPRRRNLYHAAKLRNGGALSVSSATTATTASSGTPKSSMITPQNSNICPTPKRTNMSTHRNAKLSTPRSGVCSNDNGTSFAASSVTPEKLIFLTQERDKLRSDVATFKRKLQSAIETKNTTTKEKDVEIMVLSNRLISLSKELELSKSQTRCAELQSKELEQKMHDEIKLKDTAHRRQLNEVQKKHDNASEELTRVNQLLKEMTIEKYRADTDLQEMKKELKEMKEERDGMEDNWNECLDRLDRTEAECEEKYAKQSKREAQLEQTLDDLQSEKRAAMDDAKGQLTLVEVQLNDALADKHNIEKILQDQISDLKSELQVQRSSSDNAKRHHAQIVEGLKSDLTKARQLREESRSSMHQDMEEMKKESDENVSYYKNEVENLRSQLRSTKTRADADRKKWMEEFQPQYERKIQAVKKEKKELASELAHARKDIDCLKSVRDKDIELLESELNKTYKAKVELDAEFKDTKRQLHNVLRNLDEMTLDGGKMQSDLEGVVHDFTKEKRHYQKEIDQLKSRVEDQRKKMDELSSENGRYEDSCRELRQSAASLEDRLMNEMRNNKHHDDEVGNEKEALILEIQYMSSKLAKAEDEAAFFSADAVAAATAAAEAATCNHSELSENRAKITQLQSEKLQLSTQIAQHNESMEQLRSTHRETSKELSRAQQTIQILKSKERYLESRVESLANQISKTVQDYETRLLSSASSESSCSGGRREVVSGGGIVGSSMFGAGKR